MTGLMLSIPLVIGRITGGSRPEYLVLKVDSLVIFILFVSLGHLAGLSKCGELISKIMKNDHLGRMILIKCIGKDGTQTFETQVRAHSNTTS